MKRFRWDMRKPWWEGPFLVLFAMPIAIKVDEVIAWVHYTQARPADPRSAKEDHRFHHCCCHKRTEYRGEAEGT